MNKEMKIPNPGRLKSVRSEPIISFRSDFNLILKVFNSEDFEKEKISLPAKVILKPNDYFELYDEDGIKLNIMDHRVTNMYNIKWEIN